MAAANEGAAMVANWAAEVSQEVTKTAEVEGAKETGGRGSDQEPGLRGQGQRAA